MRADHLCGARDAAIAERQRLFTALLSAPAALCVIRGPELVVEVANPRCLEAWGRTEAILGRPLLEVMPELASQPFPDMLRQVLATGAPVHVSSMIPRLDRHGHRDDVYFDFVYEPVREADDTVSSVLVFAVEVTEQVRARRAVEAALAEARAASRAKDEFLALLGHELRNPLAPILTALELMSMRGDQGVTREREVIARQANHLVRLVDDLLDVARISRGTVTLKVRCLALDEVIARSIETTSPLFEERRHHLDVAISPGLSIDGDAHRLEQVFTNLLTNAAKYSPPRGRVQVTGREEDGQVVVTVRDEGVGIAPDVLPHVFEMFTQERQSLERSKGGLGLGLAIVRALVELHGGSVRAHSAGKHLGAEFEVRLPVAATGAAAAPRPTGRRRPLTRELVGRRILVVDDNVDAAALLAEGLRALGHETRLAYDGVGALRELEQFTPDLALLDIGLPVMDGYELARRMRGRAELRRLHLVAVTGYGQVSDRDRSKTAGFDAHVVKPIELDRLCALIDQLPARG